MYNLSLNQLFGEGATQDKDVLIINKASLIKLTSSPNNTAESILVAILITALSSFQGSISDENNEIITDGNQKPIQFDNSEFYELFKIILWKPFQIQRTNLPYLINQIIVFSYGTD